MINGDMYIASVFALNYSEKTQLTTHYEY